jgi:hypothetical protein
MQRDFITKQEAQDVSIAACEEQIDKIQDLITYAAERGMCSIDTDANISEGTVVYFKKLGYGYDSYNNKLLWD